jgi:hypothetical protein
LGGFAGPVFDVSSFIEDDDIGARAGVYDEGVGAHLFVVDEGEEGGVGIVVYGSKNSVE